MAAPTHKTRTRNRFFSKVSTWGRHFRTGFCSWYTFYVWGWHFACDWLFLRGIGSPAHRKMESGHENGQIPPNLKENARSRPKGQRAGPAVGPLSAHLGDFHRIRPGGTFRVKKYFTRKAPKHCVAQCFLTILMKRGPDFGRPHT